MKRCKAWLLLSLIMPLSLDVSAQSAQVDKFLADAREGSIRYHDIENAISDGYRQIGPDFPGMGEHWVHLGRIINRDLQANRPSVLSYVRVEGKAVLTGVAYGSPTLPGESPPDIGLGDIWHSHSGTVEEETLFLNPSGVHDHGDLSLSMFHAWIWTENPSGMFEQDNWALAYLRLDLEVPDDISPAAGKALFLTTGGSEYYLKLFEKATMGKLPEKANLALLLDHHESIVRGLITETERPEVASLEGVWEDLWLTIHESVSDQTWDNLEPLAW